MKSNFHKPVLLTEVINGLRVNINKKYIDSTLGGGGHTKRILELGGEVLGIDVDQDALDYVKNEIKSEKLVIARGNFREIDKIAHLYNFDKVAGVIFDLGISSYQIDQPLRGFSLQNEGPLDMRMDKELGVRASDLIKILTKKELYEIFTKFGEENNAWTISSSIVRARDIKPIETTKDLMEVIEESLKIKGMNKNFSKREQGKRIFQALRIVVNDELNAIEEALPKAVNLLEKNGRLCVISFHSLEDRIVKNKFIEFEKENLGKIITRKPILPSENEISLNSRSKSAKLRIFETNFTN